MKCVRQGLLDKGGHLLRSGTIGARIHSQTTHKQTRDEPVQAVEFAREQWHQAAT